MKRLLLLLALAASSAAAGPTIPAGDMALRHDIQRCEVCTPRIQDPNRKVLPECGHARVTKAVEPLCVLSEDTHDVSDFLGVPRRLAMQSDEQCPVSRGRLFVDCGKLLDPHQ